MKSGDVSNCPQILGLFQKRIDGDDALLELASLRFREAGLGMEFYAESPSELEQLLRFRPLPETRVIVHLRRGLDLFSAADRHHILEFAGEFRGRIFGMVVHDQREIADRFEEYLSLLEEIEAEMDRIAGTPYMFIEYAAGIGPEVFVGLFGEIRTLTHISACIDTGHLGLWQAKRNFSTLRPGEDIFAIKPDDPRLLTSIDDILTSVSSAPETVLRVIREIGGLGKPLHLHLHDAHPLSVSSPFGVSDHLSFLDKIPISFEYKGKRRLDPMFGPSGLSRIVKEAVEALGQDRVSLTLEIHPREGRLPLGNARHLFSHWLDKGNAERMNFWLSVLRNNQRLILNTCGITDVPTERRDGMIIYNLFPLLAGRFSEWEKHLSRASEMGFTWIFVNPIQLPGSSGSMYSIKDYFSFNPLLIGRASGQSPQEQVKAVTRTAERLGLRMMVDLVINHCAADSELLKTHPGWFVREANGQVSHPFAYESGKKVVWKDLAQFDHKNTKDKEGMFRFFLDVIKFLAELGFRGFRCDAAYQVPGSLWERLIRESKKTYPDLMFFAETLGTTPDLTRKTASAGFDYIFNSSKWWDFEGNWLMQQYNLTKDVSPSISFPESHDTARLLEELNGSIAGMKQRYLFSAFFSAGVMMPMGFEFGFRKRLHVVKTKPEDWEETDVDLTSFISAVNRIKSGHAIFQEDAPAEILHNPNSRVLFMWKASSRTSDECLFILNKDIRNKQHFHEEDLKECLQAGAPLIDISPEYPMDYIPAPFSYDLDPGQAIILITSRDTVPEW